MTKSYFTLEKFLYTLLMFLIFFLSTSIIIQSKLLVLLAIYINIRLIFHYLKVVPVFLFFLFSFLYLMPFVSHFFYGAEISPYGSFNNSYYINKVLFIYSLFLISIFIFSDSKVDYIFLKIRLQQHNSVVGFYLLIFCSFLLIIFGLGGENLLSGGYGSINKTQLPIFEYTLIFIAILGSVTYGKKNRRNIILLTVIFLILKDLLYGGRITTIQALFLIYILFFEDVISKRNVYILIFAGFILIQGFTIIRNNPILFLQGRITFMDFLSYSTYFFNKDTIYTNQGDVVYSSARLIGFVETGLLSFNDRIYSLFYFLFSIVTPGFALSELSNLAAYKKDVYPAGGGSLFPVQFYVWLSYPGVIFSGYLISKFIKLFIKSKNNYILFFSILVFSTFPRWLAYSPHSLFKLSFYVIPLYFILTRINILKLNRK